MDFGNIILAERIDTVVSVLQTRVLRPALFFLSSHISMRPYLTSNINLVSFLFQFDYDPTTVSWSAFGYPAEFPFDGNRNYQCNSEEGVCQFLGGGGGSGSNLPL